MFTMALAGRAVTDWTGDPGALVEYQVRFGRPVLVPDDDEGAEVTVRGKVGALLEDGRARVDLTVTSRRREGALPGARDRPPGMSAVRRAGLAAAAVLLLAGCTSFADTVAAMPAPPRRPALGSRLDADGRGCPAQRAPSPTPTGRASASTSAWRTTGCTVTGTETVIFTAATGPWTSWCSGWSPTVPTPRRPATGWSSTASAGTTSPRGAYEEAGAAAPGGLYVVTLTTELAAGESTEVALDFTLTLGRGRLRPRSAPTTASPGGPAARRCSRGSRVSAGPRTRSSS